MIKGLKTTLFAGILAVGVSAFAAAPVVTLPEDVLVTDAATPGNFVNNEINLSTASDDGSATWSFSATGTPQYTVDGQTGGALPSGPVEIKNVALSSGAHGGAGEAFPANDLDTLRVLTFVATNGDGAGSKDVNVVTVNPNASASFAFSVQATDLTVGAAAKLVAKVTNNSGVDFTTTSLVNFGVNPADGVFFNGYTVNNVAGVGAKGVDVAVGPLANGASATVEQNVILTKVGGIELTGSALVEGTLESGSETITVTYTAADPDGSATGVNYKGTAATAVKNGVKYNAKKDTTNVKIELLTNAEGVAQDLPPKKIKWKFTADAYLLPAGETFSSPAQLGASALKKPITLKPVKAKKFTAVAKKNVVLKNVPGNLSGRTVVIKLYTFDKKTNTTDHLVETNYHDNYIVVTIP